MPGNVVDVVFAEQETDAARHPVDDLPAACYCNAVIRAEVVKMQSELVGPMDVGKDFGVFEQGLGGDAAPIKTDATEGVPLDDTGFEAELAGSDGRNVSARPATYNCYIILGIGCH